MKNKRSVLLISLMGILLTSMLFSKAPRQSSVGVKIKHINHMIIVAGETDTCCAITIRPICEDVDLDTILITGYRLKSKYAMAQKDAFEECGAAPLSAFYTKETNTCVPIRCYFKRYNVYAIRVQRVPRCKLGVDTPVFLDPSHYIAVELIFLGQRTLLKNYGPLWLKPYWTKEEKENLCYYAGIAITLAAFLQHDFIKKQFFAHVAQHYGRTLLKQEKHGSELPPYTWWISREKINKLFNESADQKNFMINNSDKRKEIAIRLVQQLSDHKEED